MAHLLWATMDISAFGNENGFNVPWAGGVMAFGLCAVGGVLLGDALTLRPQEAVRTASLAPRLVRDHVPPRMAPLLLLQAASLVALLVIGAVTASSDPAAAQSGAGRHRHLRRDTATSLGPWPGLYYSGPMFAALAVGTPACVWALRRIAHRPGDDQQRRDRAWAITGAWGLLVSSQLLLVVLMIFVALTENGAAPARWAPPPSWCSTPWACWPCSPSDGPWSPWWRPGRSTTRQPATGSSTMSDPAVRVDTTSQVPPYEQIRAQLAALILTGRLTAGERLPTVRQLAADLGLAPGTVARAYRELEAAELIRTRRGAGTRVAALPSEPAPATPTNSPLWPGTSPPPPERSAPIPRTS